MKLETQRKANLFLALILNVSLLASGCAHAYEGKVDPGKIDHIHVYVDSPTAHVENSIDYLNKLISDHSVFVGNKIKIKRFVELLEKILKFDDEKLKYLEFSDDLFLNVTFFFDGDDWNELYVSKKGEFRYNGKSFGRISESLMKEIILECESLVNIIDLRYQDSILLKSRVKSLCMPHDLSPCQ